MFSRAQKARVLGRHISHQNFQTRRWCTNNTWPGKIIDGCAIATFFIGATGYILMGLKIDMYDKTSKKTSDSDLEKSELTKLRGDFYRLSQSNEWLEREKEVKEKALQRFNDYILGHKKEIIEKECSLIIEKARDSGYNYRDNIIELAEYVRDNFDESSYPTDILIYYESKDPHFDKKIHGLTNKHMIYFSPGISLLFVFQDLHKLL